MKNYNIVTLAPSGSGKTVFLASLFKQLSTQGEYGFFIEAKNATQRNLLNTYYTEIITGENWPNTTREITEWNFTCCVKTKDLSVHRACQFIYKDYPGKMLSEIAADESDEFNINFQKEIEGADAVLTILDGQQVLNLLKGSEDKLLQIWLLKDLPTIFQIIQRSSKKIPVHFLISKWDLIENQGGFDLGDVRHRLLKKIPEFRNLIKQRNDAKCPVRLIPVSSVGMNFINFQNGEMKKIPGAVPQPFQVEVPLSCVLIDGLQVEMNYIKEQQKEILQRKTEVLPKFNFLEQVNQFVSDKFLAVLATTARNVLPEKYKFDNDTLNKLLTITERGIQQTEFHVEKVRQKVDRAKTAAARESERLHLQKEESLARVKNEETALKHIIENFIHIREYLDKEYPESDLGGAGV